MTMRAMITGCVLLSVLIAGPVAAQNTEQDTDDLPRYAVAFSTSQGVQVASLLSDQNWRVDALPPGVFFGQFDIIDCVPAWSADGHRVYVMVEPEISKPDDPETIILSRVGSYDITTQTFQIHADVLDAAAILEENETIYTGYVIESLSPDERYIWLNSTLIVGSVLVDLHTGKVIYEQPYLVTATVWYEDRVFTAAQGIFDHWGENQQFVLSLPDAKPVAVFPNAESTNSQYVPDAFWSPEYDTILFAAEFAEQQAFGLFNTVTGAFEYFDEGYDLDLAPSGRYASYVNVNRELVVLDLSTMNRTPYGEAGHYTGWHADDVLVNVVVSGAADSRDVTLITYDYGNMAEQVEEIIVQGVPDIDRIHVSPDAQRIMLHYHDDGLALYDRALGLVADSPVTTPDGTTWETAYDDNLIWGRDHAYLKLLPTTTGGSRSVAINRQGEFIIMPSYVWASESPDGDWMLMAGGLVEWEFNYMGYPELVAFSPQTGDTATLFSQTDEAVFRLAHGTLAQTLIWSPILE
ncbi:MAG: hypothetical protein JXJ20_00925 [Anaerolineae bacterium]|nr:hypothetical protein [Anaerolineae bacterium]